MTPKQKLKKLQAKAQFKNTYGYKHNKHRDRVGITLKERTKEEMRRPYVTDEYDAMMIYGGALALHTLGKIGRKK